VNIAVLCQFAILESNTLMKITYALVILSFSFSRKRTPNNFQTHRGSKYYESQEFRLLGPFRGGRSAAVTGVPGKPNLFYFGSTVVVACGKH
jgi:hypothetical protein